jgi:hypothetical protein
MPYKKTNRMKKGRPKTTIEMDRTVNGKRRTNALARRKELLFKIAKNRAEATNQTDSKTYQ